MPPKSKIRSLSSVMRNDHVTPSTHSDVQKNVSPVDSSLLASHVQFEASKRQKGRQFVNSKSHVHGNPSKSQERFAPTIQSGLQNDGSNMDTIISASGALFNGSHVRIQAPIWQLHAKSSETQVSKIANLGSISQDRLLSGVPDDVLMKAPDKRVTQGNWEALLKLWKSDKKVSEAERNKKNRGEDRATHTLGSKSIARHNQDLREQLGEDYTTLGAYIKAHQTKTGEYPDEHTRVMCEKGIGTCMERDAVNSSHPSVLSPILDMVYKRHHGGYERGRGIGWCRTLPLTNMEIQASNENVKHLTIELEKAKTEIEAMHAREREMEAREREREAREREREAQQMKEKEEILSREREMQVHFQKMEAIISLHFRNGSVGD